MWFFQTLAHLDPVQFAERVSTMTPAFETRVLAHEIVKVSRNVTDKHGLVNRGFVLAAVTLGLFLWAGVSYIALL